MWTAKRQKRPNVEGDLAITLLLANRQATGARFASTVVFCCTAPGPSTKPIGTQEQKAAVDASKIHADSAGDD